MIKQRYDADTHNPSNSAQEQEKFCTSITALSEPDLLARTKQIIWLSAFAANNPMSKYHWQGRCVLGRSGKEGQSGYLLSCLCRDIPRTIWRDTAGVREILSKG